MGERQGGGEKAIGRAIQAVRACMHLAIASALCLLCPPAARLVLAASGCLRAVRITHGMDRCLPARRFGGCGRWSPPPACHSPESRCRVPGEIHTRRRPEKAPRKASRSRHDQPATTTTTTAPPPTGIPHHAANAVLRRFCYVTGHPRPGLLATLFSYNNSHLNQ